MVVVNPLRMGLWEPFQMAFLWLINGGDPNHSLTGMILHVTWQVRDTSKAEIVYNSAIIVASQHVCK